MSSRNVIGTNSNETEADWTDERRDVIIATGEPVRAFIPARILRNGNQAKTVATLRMILKLTSDSRHINTIGTFRFLYISLKMAATIDELHREIENMQKELEELRQNNAGLAKARGKVSEMSSEVVDTNPYR